MTRDTKTTFPSDVEVVFVRRFDAPRALVWRAWTDPEMLVRWWGPHGHDAPECDVDLRPGGRYRIVARGPDGTLYPVKGVYLEIAPKTRLVMTDNAEDMPKFWRAAYNRRRGAEAGAVLGEIVLTLTLEDEGRGTKMTLVSRAATPEDRIALRQMGTDKAWRQSFEKMGAVLEKPQQTKEKTMQLIAYLSFDGNCEDAFRYYEKHLGGKIEALSRFSEAPPAEGGGEEGCAPEIPAEWKDKVMHARMSVGDSLLMGGDPPPPHYQKPQGISVNITVDDPAEADRIFAALADGGEVTMPIAETFWAKRFGMCADRFGTPWMVNCMKEEA